MREMLGLLALGLGLFVHLSAAVGLFRFRYVLNRMHAVTLSDTLGTALVLLGCALLRGSVVMSAKFLLLLVFLWLTAPVSAHLIAKAEVMLYTKEREKGDEE